LKTRIQLLSVFFLGCIVGVGSVRLFNDTAVAQEAPPDPMLAKVIQVSHGDEFEIMWRPPMPLRFSVRLNRVDTPFKDQPGGKEATEELADLIYGKTVRLEFENPEKPYQDRSNRLIAYAHIGDKNVGVEMIRSGHAEFFTKYGEGKYAKAMKAAEDQAKAAKRGRWAEDAKN